MPVDLNADLGEERGDDAALMPFITSANIACGGHAGSVETMRRTLDLALQHGLVIGAHPSYPDRASFGRSVRQFTPSQLAETLISQIDTLSISAARAGAALFHVKPHGALYNQAARDPAIARTLASAIHSYNPQLVLVGFAQSRLTEAGSVAGLRVAHEAFIDRRYEPDGTLRDRALPHAVLDDERQALDQARSIAQAGCVSASDGSLIKLQAHTLCLHGDTPHALRFARLVRAELEPLVPILRLDRLLAQ